MQYYRNNANPAFDTHVSIVFNKKYRKLSKGKRYGGPLFIFGCLDV